MGAGVGVPLGLLVVGLPGVFVLEKAERLRIPKITVVQLVY